MSIQEALDQTAKRVIAVSTPSSQEADDLLASLGDLLILDEVCEHPDFIQSIMAAIGRLSGLGEGDQEILEGVKSSIGDLLDELSELTDSSDPAPLAKSENAEQAEPVSTELLGTWISSAIDAADEAEGVLVESEGQQASSDVLDYLKRSLHNLKGECGVVGASGAQNLIHAAESAIIRTEQACAQLPTAQLLSLVDWIRGFADSVRQDSSRIAETNTQLLESLDLIGLDIDAEDQSASDSTDKVLVTGIEDIDESVTDFLSESREHLSASEAALLDLERSPEDMELVNTVFRAFHTIKGVAGFLGFDPVVELAHVTESLLDEVRSGTRPANSSLLSVVLLASDLLIRMFDALEGNCEVYESEVSPVIEAITTLPKDGSEVVIPDRVVKENTTEANTTSAAPDSTKRTVVPDQSLKVSTERLDSIVDLVGELVIAQQMVVQDPVVSSLSEQKTQRNLTQVGKIIRDLQEVSMSLRMVTMRSTFQKMSRLVRDLSSKSGKKINLVLEGEDTELDRTVVDEIRDPLIHMIRNACDHGIESAEDRTQAGKSGEGTLLLRAEHKSGSIVVTIKDDGKGLDRDKILDKAMSRNLIPADRNTSEMSDEEVFSLIFAAGFSTAESVTDVSGRGVGMDVVRRNIEALRGTVEIQSELGKGTTFHISLPLTLAIIDGMIVRVGQQRYVIPTLSIQQSFRPTEDQISTVVGRAETATVQGSLLPIHRLFHLFKVPDANELLTDTILVVIESNSSRCCLQVDELLGQQQVVIKSLGDAIGNIQGVSGGAILGDGRVAPILDVTTLLAQAEDTSGTIAGATS